MMWQLFLARLVVLAMFHVGPATEGRTQRHYSTSICAGKKKDKFPLPGAKDSEQVEITFECDGSLITHCNLPNMPRVRRDDQAEQAYIGQDGREYVIFCWSGYEPDVGENFPAKICSSANKFKSYSVRKLSHRIVFECNEQNDRIVSCKPEGYSHKAMKGETFTYGQQSQNQFTLYCDETVNPTLS